MLNVKVGDFDLGRPEIRAGPRDSGHRNRTSPFDVGRVDRGEKKSKGEPKGSEKGASKKGARGVRP